LAEVTTCAGTTAAGKPCRKRAIEGSEFCRAHEPPSLTPQEAERLLTYVRAGNVAEVARAAAGIDAERLERWLRQEATKLAEARAAAEVRLVNVITSEAATNWSAAAWLLERGFPDRWARVSQREKADDGLTSVEFDPFAEVDELAEQRRKHSS
jgi:hypothetical protein